VDCVLIAGDTADWRESLARDYPRVRGWFSHVVTDRGAVEDLSQEVFVRLYDRVTSGEAVVNPWNYVKVIARNVFLEYLRAQRREKGYRSLDEESVVATHSDPVEYCASEELAAAIPQLLGELSTPQRTVLVGVYFLGMTIRELAQAIGASASTVVERHHRAMCELRKLALHRGIEL
jgi:RNA polymerase sigma-70 factor (ECF subfamily)